MSQEFKVFIVDDDPTVVEIIGAILEPDYPQESFLSAEDCLQRLASEKPDLFLLDVNLPGMNGYELCQRIKKEAGMRNTSVIFVSGHDTIEERIKGYDAGGEDFIVKPFEPEELMRKVQVAESIVRNQRSLAEQAEQAELLSSLVMASMDETGILLQFMSKLIAMETPAEIAEELLGLMQRYRLEGVVQTRIGDDVETVSAAGINLPLEVSVIEHVRGQGRIFEFSCRGVHNFERVTLMVNNLPLDDPDYCGRLRDHLSVAAQGVDSRLKAIQAERAVLSALDNIGDTIMELRSAQQRNTQASSKLISDLQETLLNSFYKLGLTDNQEKFLQNLVGDFMGRMAELLNRDSETQNTLLRLNQRLGQLRSC
ncbi:response regulator [Propionivibrio limicola]|uniref:response regulator n=1 Tax=Propionivibrio limicola TaxID=167645 RepID=UPI0012923A98|nr:response regulator [Propionivibrio limicola]